jgi:hypothetical protein
MTTVTQEEFNSSRLFWEKKQNKTNLEYLLKNEGHIHTCMVTRGFNLNSLFLGIRI